MVNYKNGLIYTIRTGDSVYVGSTCNFNRRKQSHKVHIFNKNTQKYNRNLYVKIRENNGEWDMKPHKEFPCENKTQLTIEEERYRVELKADLNTFSCHGRDEKKKKETEKQWLLNNPDKKRAMDKRRYEKHLNSILEQKKDYYENNKEDICEKMKEKTICECGCEVRLNGLSRHKRSAKHIKLMESKKENLVL